jgi:hypothetical protein
MLDFSEVPGRSFQKRRRRFALPALWIFGPRISLKRFMPTLEQQEISVLKGRVSRLEARLEFLYRHLGVTFIEDTRPTDDPRIIEAIRANNLLEAIKLYRMATNASLEAARAGVEEMRARLGI